MREQIKSQELIYLLSNKGIKKSEVWRRRDYFAKSNPDKDVYLYNTIQKNLVEELTQNKGMSQDDAIAKVTRVLPFWKVSLFGEQYAKKFLHPLCRANTIEELLNWSDLNDCLVCDYYFKGFRRNKIVIILQDDNAFLKKNEQSWGHKYSFDECVYKIQDKRYPRFCQLPEHPIAKEECLIVRECWDILEQELKILKNKTAHIKKTKINEISSLTLIRPESTKPVSQPINTRGSDAIYFVDCSEMDMLLMCYEIQERFCTHGENGLEFRTIYKSNYPEGSAFVGEGWYKLFYPEGKSNIFYLEYLGLPE